MTEKKAGAGVRARSARAKKTKSKPAREPRRAKAPASAKSPASGASFDKVSELCLALPETKLTMTWGSPHFRVKDKIFCGFGVEDGKEVLGVKLTREHAERAVKEARFWTAPYVGKYGWVSLNLGERKSWSEVAALIRESYELIAPPALRAKLR